MSSILPKYQAVLFDLDGTLIDTAPDFYPTVNAIRADYDLAAIADEVMRSHISNGSLALATHFLAPDIDKPLDELRQAFLDRFHEFNGKRAKLFVDMKQTLQTLQFNDIPWGIVTQKPYAYAQPLIRYMSLDKHCQTLICPDHVKESKPNPEGLFLACDQMGIEAHECLYIGDHLRDIQAGQNANMDTAAALYGYIGDDVDPKTWNSTYEIYSPKDIMDLLTP